MSIFQLTDDGKSGGGSEHHEVSGVAYLNQQIVQLCGQMFNHPPCLSL